MKEIILTIALLLFTTVVRAQYNQVNDIPYREAAEGYAQERCKLDVYYPTNAQDAPVVVWFHGGGIEGGEKHIDPQLKNSGLVDVAYYDGHLYKLIFLQRCAQWFVCRGGVCLLMA